MFSKKKLARNRCAASIRSITATMGHRPEVFPVSHDRRTDLIATNGFKSGIACALLFKTPSSSPSPPGEQGSPLLDASVYRQRRDIHCKSATGRIRRGEPWG